MRALILDFDGTIADSEGIHGEALQAACREHDFDCAVGLVVGLADPDGVRAAFDAAGRTWDPVVGEQILRRKVELVADRLRKGDVSIYDGVARLIHEVAGELPVAVCSAARRSEILPVLERHDLMEPLRTIVADEDVPDSKPHPGGYLLTAERLGVVPADCAAIEDSIHGLRAAHSAGMVTVAVTHTTHASHLTLADHVVDRIGTLTLGGLRAVHAAADRGHAPAS